MRRFLSNYFDVLLYFQLSVSHDDDISQMNGELTPASKHDGFMTEKNQATTSLSAQHNSRSSEANQLPRTDINQPVCRDSGMNDNRNGNDEGMLDDIYDFELSEDQKQALQELDNLKLDLRFTAG